MIFLQFSSFSLFISVHEDNLSFRNEMMRIPIRSYSCDKVMLGILIMCLKDWDNCPKRPKFIYDDQFSLKGLANLVINLSIVSI